MTWVFVSFNVLANFFIYSLTVTSFRAFLKTKMGNVMSSVYRSSSNSGELLNLVNPICSAHIHNMIS